MSLKNKMTPRLNWRKWEYTAGADRKEIHLALFELRYANNKTLFSVEFRIDVYYSGARPHRDPDISVYYVLGADEDRNDYQLFALNAISSVDTAKSLCEQELRKMLLQLHQGSKT